MAKTFYFYDLETSGVKPSTAHIMQFAGQRTDMNLKPIGEPHNLLIKMTNDVLPEPDAVLITGITPQKTTAEGITEAEFLKFFHATVVKPGTVFLGYNTVRFDDEFMRYLHYRNFYDPYEWQWQEECDRWDLLDVVRMTRALRPKGIKWPVNSDGRPSNQLGLITSINKLSHQSAHDALGDVLATIEVAQLLKRKQPKLFDFLYSLRTKQAVAEFCQQHQQFVYSSGKYPSEFEKTTVVAKLAAHPKRQGVLVYDLRHDPEPFANMTARELADSWRWRPKEENDSSRLPVKTLQFNRCPAIAPVSVLHTEDKQRLQIDDTKLQANYKKLQKIPDFKKRVLEALEILDKKQQAELFADERVVDRLLYDGFFESTDKQTMAKVRSSSPENIMTFSDDLKDQRLKDLLPLYKARNFPQALSAEEEAVWEQFRAKTLLAGDDASKFARYFKRIEELAGQVKTKEQGYLLEELKLWGESILPDTY